MDPMKMFGDWTTSTNDIYDFDLLTSEQKKIFIKKMFDGERLYAEIMFNGPLGEFFYNLFEDIYRNKGEDMANNLKGKMTSAQFCSYFVSFFAVTKKLFFKSLLYDIKNVFF